MLRPIHQDPAEMAGDSLDMTLDTTMGVTTGLDPRTAEISGHRTLQFTERSQRPSPTRLAVNRPRLTVAEARTVAANQESIKAPEDALNALRSRPFTKLVPAGMDWKETTEIPVGRRTRAGPTNMTSTSLSVDPDSRLHHHDVLIRGWGIGTG